ncbi:MAG: hypothetical protein ACE5JX_10540 [Acidobacteriota bacterium]
MKGYYGLPYVLSREDFVSALRVGVVLIGIGIGFAIAVTVDCNGGEQWA